MEEPKTNDRERSNASWSDLLGLFSDTTSSKTEAAPIPEREVCQGEIFRAKRLADNLIRLRLIAKVYIGLVLWFATLNAAALLTSSRSFSSIYYHPVLYGTVFVLNVYTLLVARSHRRIEGPRRLRFYERFISAYVLIMMALGAVISLIDQPDFGHLMVFTLNMLICSSFLLTDMRQIVVPIVASSAILVVGLPFWTQSRNELRWLYQELVSYVPIAFAISRVLYKAYCDNYRSKFKLERQIETNRVLNERLRAANDHLGTLACVDELTGIANRRGLYVYMDELLLKADGSFSFAAIMIDIDYFKEYNDLYGHGQGDTVLSQIAGVLNKIAVANSDLVSRWGGEEFLYITRDKSKHEVIEICEVIRHKMNAMRIPHAGSRVASHITLSQGACVRVVGTHEEMQSCIHQADNALYATKARGRNGYAFISPTEDGEVLP